MIEKLTYNLPTDKEYFLESKKLDLEAGWLGKCFGSKSTAPSNIASFSIATLIISGIAVLFFNSSIQAGEYWKIIAPLITLSLGYLFGKSSKEF